MAAIAVIALRLAPYVLGLFALWYGWHLVDGRCWSSACVTKSRQLQTTVEEMERAKQRATDLALLWSKAINNVEVRYVERSRDRVDSAAALHARARQSRPDTAGVSIRVPPVAASLLYDAERFANATAPPAEHQEPPEAVPAAPVDTTLDEWVTFAVDAADAYRDARDKWEACVAAYEALRM